MTTQLPTQFRTQAELVDYLGAIERRVAELEQENQQQQQAIDELHQEQLPAVPVPAPAAEPILPKTGLLSKSFMTRAFTVWGNAFVASLIIAIGLGLIAVVIYLIMYGLSTGII